MKKVIAMRGALVFLIVFVVLLVATLGYPSLPPGIQIYDALGITQSEYPIMGIPATTFGSAILNGVVYGVIVWLIYSLVDRQRVDVVVKTEENPEST